MKKIIHVLIPIGLLTILYTLLFSYAQASDIYLRVPKSIVARSEPERDETPWFDGEWNYRKRIVITNNGSGLAWYQVLIKLDGTNFNFNRTKIDGSDVRFTHSDGTTGLSYWIESWDSANHLAYLWVRVPGIPTGNTVIYLYYDNPDADSVSAGIATFDSFDDDWGQFSRIGFTQTELFQDIQLNGNFYSPFSWSIISGSPEASGGILSLENGDGIKSSSLYLYNAMGMRANFTSGAGYEWGGFIDGSDGQRTMIGDLPSDPNNLFLHGYRDNLDTILFPRVGGEDWHNNYHIYEVRWNSDQTMGDIDHGISTATFFQSAHIPDISLPVTLYSYIGSEATLMVDWVYIRQYRDPEPMIMVGIEQGLVALSISNIDSPDPIRTGQRLTYQLTISNTSEIDAPGVLVTDTLPVNVQIGPISSSQGNCIPNRTVLCNLNTINANSTAQVTIIVTPTVAGEIANASVVGSPGYELILGDNHSEQLTLVDSTPPIVTWVSPIGDGGIYHTAGGSVTLDVSASDNDQIDRVEFWWVDHGVYLPISTASTPPYQALFNSSILEPGDEYFFEARAFDRAGNSNFPDHRKYIFIVRSLSNFLPVVYK